MKKNILILYAEVMPYNIPVYKELVKKGYKIKVIQIDKKKLTPYAHSEIEDVEILNISSFANYENFSNYCISCSPVLIMISEVMERWYWKIAATFHKKNKSLPIVLGSDAQWSGSLNNWIKKIFFCVTYRRCFTNVLSAGLWQCVYALKIGFKRDQILTPLYSADNELYHKVDIDIKRNAYPKKFLFVGRLEEVKGIRILVEAWNEIKDKDGWQLTIVGNGTMDSFIKKYPNIELIPFSSQSEICRIMENSGCAIIPSLFEPWGLVIHEAASAGLPIIVTKNCGATNQFVVNRSNGLLIEENSVESLKDAMLKVIGSNSSDLLEMSYNSRKQSYKINPENVAFALISLIKD